MNMAAPMDGWRGPRAGDVSLCSGCGALLQYTATMGLEPLPEVVLGALPRNSREMLLKAQAVVLKYRNSKAA